MIHHLLSIAYLIFMHAGVVYIYAHALCNVCMHGSFKCMHIMHCMQQSHIHSRTSELTAVLTDLLYSHKITVSLAKHLLLVVSLTTLYIINPADLKVFSWKSSSYLILQHKMSLLEIAIKKWSTCLHVYLHINNS